VAIDEDHDDGLGGRSRDRREFTAANRWAGPLCALDAVQLAAAPLPDAVREAVVLYDSIPTHRARNRQAQRIDKLVRILDEEQIAAIDAFLANPEVAHAEADAWVDRLVRDGDAALDEWIAQHPDADRQRLRRLARNARDGSADRRKALRDALFG
jgi:ribosome-associated protein